MSAAEYALLQLKYRRENLLKEVSSHRDRARETETYILASHRNSLEEQRHNLRYGIEKLAPPLQKYYLEQIMQLEAGIASSKKRFPMFRGNYDVDY